MSKRPRRTPSRAALVHRIHPGLRPRLTRAQIVDLALVHASNHDAIRTGAASAAIMWAWAEGALTWSRVAELLGRGEDEMGSQLLLVESVIERYRRTGRVGYSGPELQAAAYGVQVMDALAESVDHGTAIEAALWSAQQVLRMQPAAAEAN